MDLTAHSNDVALCVARWTDPKLECLRRRVMAGDVPALPEQLAEFVEGFHLAVVFQPSVADDALWKRRRRDFTQHYCEQLAFAEHRVVVREWCFPKNLLESVFCPQNPLIPK